MAFNPTLIGSGYQDAISFATSATVSVDCGSGAGRFIVAFAHIDGTGTAGIVPNTCTVGGVSMTAGVQGQLGHVNLSSKLFWLSTGLPTGIQDVTMTLTGALSRKPALKVWVFQDASASTINFSGNATSEQITSGLALQSAGASTPSTDSILFIAGMVDRGAAAVLTVTSPAVAVSTNNGGSLYSTSGIRSPGTGGTVSAQWEWGGNSSAAKHTLVIEGAIADVTPPTLTSPSATVTGTTSASFSVTTNEGNGTLFRLASANPTETTATVIAAAVSQAVSGTGPQTGNFTGLTAGTTYYPHFAHRDAATNVVTTASSGASFTTWQSPAISVQPISQSVVGPSTVTFSLTASGIPAPTYQWRRNPGGNTSFSDIVGATGNNYITPATSVTGGSANNGDTYQCVVTNSASSVTSNTVTLTVSAPIDAVPPVHTGVLTESAITTNGYTLSWPAATDNFSVTGYELSLDGGSTWAPLGNVLTTNVSGRTPGSTDSCHVRAYDVAGNRSTPALIKAVTLINTSVSTDPLENLSGSLYLGAVINYSWFPGGRIGSLAGITPTEGTGTTHAVSGVLTITGLELGSGVMLTCARDTDAGTDGIHYQALTVV